MWSQMTFPDWFQYQDALLAELYSTVLCTVGGTKTLVAHMAVSACPSVRAGPIIPGGTYLARSTGIQRHRLGVPESRLL